MIAKWGICVLLVGLLALSTGCRTPQPNLKPDTTAEVLNDPPAGQYGQASMPRQAFDKLPDPSKYAIENAKGSGSVVPTRGGGMGQGGMPGR